MKDLEAGLGGTTSWAAAWAATERVLLAKRGAFALACIVLLSLCMRWHISKECSLWLDEAATHVGVLKPWPKVLSGPSPGHPPLMYVLVKLATNVFGNSETAVRSVSLFFGCVLLVAIYELCLELGLSVGRALLVVATFALTPFFIRHATEARHYALLTSFATLAITRALRLLRGSQRTSDLIGFAVCVLALPATHYFGLAYAAALLGSVTLGSALGWKQASRYRRWAVLGVLLVCLVGLGFIAVRAAHVGRSFGVGKGSDGGGSFAFNSELLRAIAGEFSLLENQVWQFVLEPALALLGLVLLSRQLRGVARLLPLGLGVVPCIAALFMSAEHFLSPRYLAPSAVLYHLGACVALFAAVDGARSALGRSGRVTFVAPLVGALTLIGLIAARCVEYPNGFGVGGDDYRAFQRYFKANLAKDTALVAYPGLFGKFLIDKEYRVGQKSIGLEKFRAAKGGRRRYLIVEIHSGTEERQAEIASLIEQTFGLSEQAWHALPLVPLPHSVYQPAVPARIVEVASDWSPSQAKKKKKPRRRKPRAPQEVPMSDVASSDDAE